MEKQLLSHSPVNMEDYITMAQESAMVADMYEDVHRDMTSSVLTDYMPASWVTMVKVKQNYFTALSHHYMAVGLLDQPGKYSSS